MRHSFVNFTFEPIVQSLGIEGQASFDYLRSNEELSARLSEINYFGSSIFRTCIPSDFATLGKVGFFPFAEAGTDLQYAITNALTGTYKSSYFCLRSFLEIGFVGLYFTSSAATASQGRKWVNGPDATPFFSRSLKALFRLPEYAEANTKIGLEALIRDTYNMISDRVHTRGFINGHIMLNSSNRPRFIEERLVEFARMASACCEVLAITLSIQHPLVLIPLPVDDKFGLNPPMSGFLQAYDVEVLKSFIPASKLAWLEKYAAENSEAQSLKNWIEALPDITEEQYQAQVHQRKETLKEMSGK